MERKFYTDDFEELLKEKADEFRMYPSKRVWHSIYNDLHPARKWPSIAISMVLIIALLMVGYWNNKPNTNSVTARQSSTTSGGGDKVASTSTSSSAVETAKNSLSFITSGQQPTGSNLQQPDNGSTFNINNNSNNTATAKPNYTTSFSASQSGNKLPQSKNTASTRNGNIVKDSRVNNKNTASSAITAVVIQSGIADNNETPFFKPGNNNGTGKPNAAINHQTAANTGKATVSAALSGSIANASDGVIADDPSNEEKESTANNFAGTGAGHINNGNTVSTTPINDLTATVNADKINNKEKEADLKTDAPAKKLKSINKLLSAEDDKVWIDNYAFYNKSKRKKWQDRTALEYYITPGIGYRRLSNDAKYNLPASSPSAASTTALAGVDARNAVTQRPGPGFEAGVSLRYKLAKNLVVKAGVQADYTNYAIYANELNHPVLTTLMLLDPNSGYPTMYAAHSTLSNIPGVLASSIVHNQTYQVSLPVGAAFKLVETKKLEWYVGGTVQPTYVFGGKAYLISADRGYYVSDPSLIRRWNVNTGIETFINYKFDNFTLMAGPQLRYQMMSTYYKKYTVNENLYNVGLKIGIVKNF
ncbi:MAG: hypothetical protein JST86_07290 [Bacteroidetes bacterium]|nr:hypothetical protein [Bacteroidota bacterium]